MEVIIRESIKQIKEKACSVFLQKLLSQIYSSLWSSITISLMIVTITKGLQAWAWADDKAFLV